MEELSDLEWRVLLFTYNGLAPEDMQGKMLAGNAMIRSAIRIACYDLAAKGYIEPDGHSSDEASFVGERNDDNEPDNRPISSIILTNKGVSLVKQSLGKRLLFNYERSFIMPGVVPVWITDEDKSRFEQFAYSVFMPKVIEMINKVNGYIKVIVSQDGSVYSYNPVVTGDVIEEVYKHAKMKPYK